MARTLSRGGQRALKPGVNEITIKVVNAWVNRLIGDEQAGAKRITFADVKPYKATSPPPPSGLLWACDGRTPGHGITSVFVIG